MAAVLLFLPLALAVGLTALAASLHRRLPPRVAARILVASLVIVAAAALPSLWIIAISYLAHLPLVGQGFQWCAMAFGFHGGVPAYLAIPSLGLTAFGTFRAFRVLRRDRQVRIESPGPIEYVESPELFAVTIPGRGGRIVLSTGLMDVVNAQEFDVVVAHEQAHARNRHDRYLLCARVVAASLPLMKPVTARLHYALERWADESAVVRCGGDRVLVARTLARVALNEPAKANAFALGFASLGVVGRVEALLAPARPRPARSLVATLWIATAIAAVLSAVQLHHLGSLIAVLCPT